MLRLAETEAIELCMAPAMIEELAEVLCHEKFQRRMVQLNLSASDLLAYAIDLASAFDVPDSGPVIMAADPDEDVFLRCALAAQASSVVSGDHHLFDLQDHAGIPILSVRQLLDRHFPERSS